MSDRVCRDCGSDRACLECSFVEDNADEVRALRSRLTEAERLLKAWRGGGFPRAETDAFLASPTSPTERAEPCEACGGAGKLPVLDFDEDSMPFAAGESTCPRCRPTPPKGTAP